MNKSDESSTAMKEFIFGVEPNASTLRGPRLYQPKGGLILAANGKQRVGGRNRQFSRPPS